MDFLDETIAKPSFCGTWGWCILHVQIFLPCLNMSNFLHLPHRTAPHRGHCLACWGTNFFLPHFPHGPTGFVLILSCAFFLLTHCEHKYNLLASCTISDRLHRLQYKLSHIKHFLPLYISTSCSSEIFFIVSRIRWRPRARERDRRFYIKKKPTWLHLTHESSSTFTNANSYFLNVSPKERSLSLFLLLPLPILQSHTL